MANSFVFYESFYEAIEDLPDEYKADAYRAICEYALFGKEPERGGVISAVLRLVKPILDSNQKRRDNGAKGGRPTEKTKQEPNHNQTEPNRNQTEPNHNQTVTKQNQTQTKHKPNIGKAKPDVDVDVDVEVDGDINPPTPLSDPVERSSLSDPAKDKLREWLQYKKERRESYKPTGLKSLITQVEKHERERGAVYVIDEIDQAMSSGWKGIQWRERGHPRPLTGVDAALQMVMEGMYDDPGG